MMREAPLAIVIPAFKARFLSEAIRSVLNQTNQNFRLYVCDDGSPEDLASITRPLIDGTRHVFHRFEDNLGGRSLAAQWTRCVDLSCEEWVWLFSDDDVMSADCVDCFLGSLKGIATGENVYRFNTLTIDDSGEIVRVNPPHPKRELPLQFAYHRLRRERSSFVSEYIFSRAALDRNNGFFPLPAGWGSDDATWICLSGEKPIVTLDEGRVFWRSSDLNISNRRDATGTLKLQAALQYLEWLLRKFSREPRAVDGIDPKVLLTESRAWFRSQIADLRRPLSYREIKLLAPRFHDVWGDTVGRATAILLLCNANHWEWRFKHSLASLARRCFSSPHN